MARFYDVVGYADETTETTPGVFKDQMIAYSYYGDVIRDSRQLDGSQKVNADVTVGVSISILADEYANEHIFAMRYVRWAGSLWTVSDVTVQRPRLVLRLGGVYNGPTAP
jgi:fructose-1,6-bisphosphatase